LRGDRHRRARQRHGGRHRGPPGRAAPGGRHPVLSRAGPVRHLRAHDRHPALPPGGPFRRCRGTPDMSRVLTGTAPVVGALLVLVILPLVLPDWLEFLLTVALAKALVVLGVAVLLRSGLVSFGHGLYFAAGAYT